MAIPAKNIDEVLDELDKIIDVTESENNFTGIFAYVYRRTTAQIKEAIRQKQFEDNERMEVMDVAFANLYLMAYREYATKGSCSESWKAAFEAKNKSITIIQHVMLGMNAHINLDLGIATASFAPGTGMDLFKNDFMKVNMILNSLVNELQDRVGRVSRLMLLLDWLGKNTDEVIINFSMAEAREQAWTFASYLSGLDAITQSITIAKKDKRIAAFGELVRTPPGILLKIVTKIIALFEEKDIKTVILKLRA